MVATGVLRIAVTFYVSAGLALALENLGQDSRVFSLILDHQGRAAADRGIGERTAGAPPPGPLMRREAAGGGPSESSDPAASLAEAEDQDSSGRSTANLGAIEEDAARMAEAAYDPTDMPAPDGWVLFTSATANVGSASDFAAIYEQRVPLDLKPDMVVTLTGGREGKLCTDEGGRIICDGGSTSATRLQKFQVVEAGRGQLVLRGSNEGKLCRDEGNVVQCTSDTVGTAERFTLQKDGYRWNLKGGKSGRWCSDRPDGLRCDRAADQKLSAWERFELRCLERCPAARSPNCLLAFAGSNEDQDWMSNMKVAKQEISAFGVSANVHKGFFSKVESFLTSPMWASTFYPKLRNNCSDVSVVGHSLGAAVATLFAALVNNGRVSKLPFPSGGATEISGLRVSRIFSFGSPGVSYGSPLRNGLTADGTFGGARFFYVGSQGPRPKFDPCPAAGNPIGLLHPLMKAVRLTESSKEELAASNVDAPQVPKASQLLGQVSDYNQHYPFQYTNRIAAVYP